MSLSQPAVQRLFGTDRLLTLAIQPLHVNDMQNAERNLNYALLLKSCLDIVPELEAILATGLHPFFVKMRKVCVSSQLINIGRFLARDTFHFIFIVYRMLNKDELIHCVTLYHLYLSLENTHYLFMIHPHDRS